MKHEKFPYIKLTLKEGLRYLIIFATLLQFSIVMSIGFMGERNIGNNETSQSEIDVQLETKAVMLITEDLQKELAYELDELIEASEVEVDDHSGIDNEELGQMDDVESETEIETQNTETIPNEPLRVYQLQGRYAYYSGEMIQFRIGGLLPGGLPDGTVLEVRMPHPHTNSFLASATTGLGTPIVTTSGTERIIRYTVGAGAVDFSAPIQMATSNSATPNGFQIPVTARLINVNNDDEILEETQTVFIVNTAEPQLRRRVMVNVTGNVGFAWSESGADHVFVDRVGIESQANPGHFSEDFRELVPVSFIYHVNFPGTWGNRNSTGLIFYDRVPDEAFFVQQLNPGWTFDEITRTARFERSGNILLDNAGIGGGTFPTGSITAPNNPFLTNQTTQLVMSNSPVLRLYFPDAPINDTFTSEARVTGRGVGTDCEVNPEDCFDLSAELNFSLGADAGNFNGSIAQSPNQGSTQRVLISHTRVLGDNTREPGPDDTRNFVTTMSYSTNLSRVSANSSALSHFTLLPLENVEISIQNLNPALYYRGITLPARSADLFTSNSSGTYPDAFASRTPGTLTVRVRLADDTVVTVAENITITTAQHIDFSEFDFDSKDIVQIFVTPTEGSYFLPSVAGGSSANTFSITTHTGPRDPNEIIIPQGEEVRLLANGATFRRNAFNSELTASNNAGGILGYQLIDPPRMGILHTPSPRTTSGLPATGTTPDYLNGERRHMRLDVNVQNLLAGTEAETGRILVLLPEGLRFVLGSLEFFGLAQTTTTMTTEQLNDDLRVVENFEGTGQTALFIYLQPFSRTIDSIGTAHGPIRAFSIVYQVDVTEDAIEGTHTAPAHFYWSNRDEIVPASLPTGQSSLRRQYLIQDVYDLADDGLESIISEGQALVRVRPPRREVSLVKATPRTMSLFQGGQPLTNMMGNEITYTLTVSFREMFSDDVVETNYLVDLLPLGMEFVPGSQQLHYFNGLSSPVVLAPTVASNARSEMTSGNIAPEVVPNFMGTGQTALIFPLQDLIVQEVAAITGTRPAFRITYRTRITSVMEGGANTNSAYLSWLNQETMVAGTETPSMAATGVTSFPSSAVDITLTPDLWGLTGDMNNTLVRSRTTIHYTPPSELLMFKEVRGNRDTNFLIYPAVGASEVGTYVDYRLRLINNREHDVHPENFQLIDVLPYAGDERGSTFTPILTGPITVPIGYRVYYTTDGIDQMHSIADFVAAANWETTVTDFADVTAIRIEMNDGHVLERETEVVFDVRLNVPNNVTFTSDDLAVNTFYTLAIGGDNYFVSNEAHLRFFEYIVDGYVFHDLDEDGVLDHEIDDVFANHLVELLRQTEMGYEVIATTTTDERGFYSFNTIHPGHYFIRVHAPTGLAHFTYSIEGEYGATAFDPTTAFSEGFDLNTTNLRQRINAAFVGDLTPPITGLSNHTLLSIGLLLSILVIGTIYVTLRAKKHSEQHRITE